MSDEIRSVVRTDTGPFVAVPVWVLYAGLDEGAIAVYVAIVSYADQRGVKFPGQRIIGELFGISWSTVHRRIKALVDVGALSIIGRADESGRQTSNIYLVHRARPEGIPVVLASPVEGDSRTDARDVPSRDARGGTRSTRTNSGVVTGDRPAAARDTGGGSVTSIEETRAKDAADRAEAVDVETAQTRIREAHAELRERRTSQRVDL